jgi:hypothetical protein
MISFKEFKKQLNLRCKYCAETFTLRQAKSRHIKMNRCPEIKKLIAIGDIKRFTQTKKLKLVHEPAPPVPEM